MGAPEAADTTFLPSLSRRDLAVEEAESNVLPVARPVAAANLCHDLVLLDGLLLRRPEAKVAAGAGC